MKIKNLSFVEKHIEKVVLSVCVLITALVLWSFVLQMPYGVKIGTSDDLVPPDGVDEKLSDVVNKLDKAIHDPKSPVPPMPVPNYTKGFKARVERGLAGIPEYDSPFGPPGLDPTVFQVKPLPPPEYMIRIPPPPENVMVRSDFAVLAKPADEKIDKVLSLAINKPAQPYDFYYATVQASFSMEKWRTLLRTAPENQRIPEEMWRGALLMVDVVLKRQTWDAANQRWGDEVTIDPLPGLPSYRNPPQSYSHQEAVDTVDQIRAAQELINRAPFPQITSERPWVAPDAKDEKATPAEPAGKPARTSQPDPNKTGEKAAARPGAAPARPGAIPGGPVGPGGPGGPAIAGGPVGPGGPGGAPIPGVVPGEAAPAAVKPTVISDLDHVKIWAHDITIKPGNKYRYAVEAYVLNPLFQKPRLAGEQRRMFFHRPSIKSETSEWSAEIVIPKPNRYFLVGADETNQTLTIEVWSIFNGAWRPQEFVVRAGDSIGRIVKLTTPDKKFESDVDLHMGVLVVDADFKAASAKQGLNEKTTRAIFLDPATNKLLTRSLEEDKDNAERTSLKSGPLTKID